MSVLMVTSTQLPTSMRCSRGGVSSANADTGLAAGVGAGGGKGPIERLLLPDFVGGGAHGTGRNHDLREDLVGM